MSIDPKLEIILKIVLTIANAVVNGTIVLTGVVSPQTATAVFAVCQVLVSVIGIVLTAFSSSKPGPLAPADPAVVVAATKVADLKPSDHPMTIATTKSAAIAAIENHNP